MKLSNLKQIAKNNFFISNYYCFSAFLDEKITLKP